MLRYAVEMNLGDTVSLPKRAVQKAARAVLPKPRLVAAEIGAWTLLYRPQTTDRIELRYTFEREPYLKRVAAEYRPMPGHVIVDVGANFGGWAVTMAVMHRARVYAIEPTAETFRVLDANVALNGLRERITTSHLALSDRAGQLTIYHSDQGARANSFSSAGHGVIGHETVRASSLAAYLTEQQIARVDFMKLNCEGAEWSILCGASVETLQKIGCAIVYVHEDLMPGRSATEIIHALEASGMTCRTGPDPGGSPLRPVIIASRPDRTGKAS